MWLNYFKIIMRNMRRELMYTVINIMGLAIGIAASIVILMHVQNELSFDKSFKNGENVYRVGVSFMNLGQFANSPEQLKEVIENSGLEIQAISRIRSTGSENVYLGEERFHAPTIFYVDSTYFELFEHNFLSGDFRTALSDPQSIVLSRSLAEQLFGSADALGQNLLIGKKKYPATVTGVVDLASVNTHLQSDAWLPMHTMLENKKNWMSASFYTYFEVQPGVTRERVEDVLEQIRKNHVYPQVGNDQPYEGWIISPQAYQFLLIPFQDIYFDTTQEFDLTAGGNLKMVYVFSFVAMLILLIAAINFVNLSTARSGRRAREVGIRKTFGTTKKSLIVQFMMESVLMSVIAMVIAFGLSESFLIGYQQIIGRELIATGTDTVSFFVLILGVTVATGLVAGIYPALYLTSFQPSQVLKKGPDVPMGSFGMGRNLLVAFQFTVSVVLIICSIFIFYQIDFMKNKDLGFKKDHVLVISNASALGDRLGAFKQSIDDKSYVISSSLMHRLPAGSAKMIKTFQSEFMGGSENLHFFPGDHDFVETLGVEIIDGRNFNENLASDSNAVLINQSAIKELHLDKPVGEFLNDNMEIIGVVKDFHYESLEMSVQPAVIGLDPTGNRLAIKVQSGSEQQLIQDIEHLWKDQLEEEAVSYYFLEANFLAMLVKEEQTGQSIALFTGLAIFVSCLGLFGLSAYTAEKRKKEIGIRKVLGASIMHINRMMIKNFSLPIIYSLLLAIPVAYIIVRWWLWQFAYRVEMSADIFVLVAVVILLLAWITVSFYTIKSALKNPVDSLHEE